MDQSIQVPPTEIWLAKQNINNEITALPFCFLIHFTWSA